MSHSFLDFADFDAAYRYSSSPSIGTAQLEFIRPADKPTLIHIRAPASRSLPLSPPPQGVFSARRRTHSDTTAQSRPTSLTPNASAGAERPISAILVTFTPIHWTATPTNDPHPGTNTVIPSSADSEDVEAVSPKSNYPGILQRTLRRETTGLSVRIQEDPGVVSRRIGTSLVAIKSPYPPGMLVRDRGRRKVREWVGRVVERVRR